MDSGWRLPDLLAGHLWDLHVKRDRFRIQVSED